MAYDLFEDIKNKPTTAIVGQLLQVPVFREQLHKGISTVTQDQKFRVVEVNNADEEDQEAIDSEDEQDHKYTPAYTTCLIKNKEFEAIVDTGAARYLISKNALDRLGWKINKLTNLIYITAEGRKATPLGIIKQVPITIKDVTATVDMVVSDAPNYDILLDMPYLRQLDVQISLGGDHPHMLITQYGDET